MQNEEVERLCDEARETEEPVDLRGYAAESQTLQPGPEWSAQIDVNGLSDSPRLGRLSPAHRGHVRPEYYTTIRLTPDEPTPIKRDVTIKTLNAGWNIEIGCHKLAYSDVGRMLSDLEMYLRYPKATEAFFSQHKRVPTSYEELLTII